MLELEVFVQLLQCSDNMFSCKDKLPCLKSFKSRCLLGRSLKQEFVLQFISPRQEILILRHHKQLLSLKEELNFLLLSDTLPVLRKLEGERKVTESGWFPSSSFLIQPYIPSGWFRLSTGSFLIASGYLKLSASTGRIRYYLFSRGESWRKFLSSYLCQMTALAQKSKSVVPWMLRCIWMHVWHKENP